jgi:hypothetical protein
VFLLVCWQWQPGWALVQVTQQQVHHAALLAPPSTMRAAVLAAVQTPLAMRTVQNMSHHGWWWDIPFWFQPGACLALECS